MKKSKKNTRDIKGVDVSGTNVSKKTIAPTAELLDVDAPVKFLPMLNQPESNVINMGMADFTEDALRRYGSYVVEERAIPDFRDGLKPSHRAVLWSLCGLGLRPSSSYKKSARTVGDAIGKYHPHGDAATYGAMVTIANTMPPVVDGQGNWGTPINMAAAYRYTEAKISKFAHLFMADTKYLEVIPKVPNFSGDDVIPLYMPALLPYILFIGNVPAPAYGVRAGNPSFSFKSVAKVVIEMLKGVEYNHKKLAKQLKIQHAFGCDDATDDDAFLEMISTGKGNITYMPKADYDFDKRVIRIQSFTPGSLSSVKNIDNTLAKISNIEGVREAYSAQGKKSVGSGPYGALFNIELQKSLSDDRFDSICEKVDHIITSSVNYRLGITIRKSDETNKFKYVNYLSLLQAWIKYRIALEVKMIKHLKMKAERDLHINEVYLFAIENMDKILKILPKVLVAKEPDVTLASALKMPVEDATIILDRKVRQLAKLEAGAIKEKVRALKAEIMQLSKDLKDPGGRAARDTEERVATYLKSPDSPQSGLKFE